MHALAHDGPDESHPATLTGMSAETGPDCETAAERPPVVAIVGRPNVGKSTLLNALARSRIAIVEMTPGVTRDRVGVLCTVAEKTVELVDTGGVGIVDAQGLDEHVEAQINSAVEQAAAILFVVDARDGPMMLDERVANLLRRFADRVILVANKVESDKIGWSVAEFTAYGYGEPVAISAKEGYHLDDLEARIDPLLPETAQILTRPAPPDLKLALVGRVNAGKSTFVNKLLNDERMIVSEIPGTTRDSVDLRFERDGKSFVVIDTAGIRKEKSVQGSVEFYAQRRAEKAMRRADVTALLLDATIDTGRLDRQIADYALRHHQPMIIVCNKWDLRPRGMKPKDFSAYLEKTLPGLRFAPVVFTSALTGHNVEQVVDIAIDLAEQSRHRVSTAEVNRVLEEAYARRKPRPRQGRIGKLYYGSQVDVSPPTFLLFVNERYLFQPAYIRYLENRFRDALPFPEIPLHIVLKERERSPSKNQ